MTPRKLNILFGFPSYGGNGGISSEVPHIRHWWADVKHQLKLEQAKPDGRIGEFYEKTIGDTPITMVRNRFVNLARSHDCDVLVMIDSDQNPQHHAGEPWYKPFFPTAFDYLYDNYDKGPHVLFAPYCGPPPVENVYVFQWTNTMNHQGIDETVTSLDQYTRAEAAKMTGIQEAAAGPTGLIMYDMRAFDLIDPPYFHYEWEDETQAQKASTEDVQNLRDISLAGMLKLGYNLMLCCWDSWIGHNKPWDCGKPLEWTADNVAQKFQNAIKRGPRTVLADVKFEQPPGITQPEKPAVPAYEAGAHVIDCETKECIRCGVKHDEDMEMGVCHPTKDWPDARNKMRPIPTESPEARSYAIMSRWVANGKPSVHKFLRDHGIDVLDFKAACEAHPDVMPALIDVDPRGIDPDDLDAVTCPVCDVAIGPEGFCYGCAADDGTL
jgi:hypothetical protein